MFDQFWSLLLIGSILMCGMMMAIWLVSLKVKNAGIVDVAWSAGFSILTCLYAGGVDGFFPRKVMITSLVLFWSLRLTFHLLDRLLRSHPVEDTRYDKLRKKWVPNTQLKFFAFFELQAIMLVFLSVPFLLIMTNPVGKITVLEWLGLAVFMVGFLGESIADRQLAQFKADPENQKKVCEKGLWHYSRHPNYFFEWVNWCAFFIMACSSPYGWTTFYAPVLMLYVLTQVTGIPMAEEASILSKGDAYVRYQNSTNAFFPWFKSNHV